MAIVSVNSKVCGIFDSCNWNITHGAEAVHILGRHSAVEIAITSAEAISVSCSGFRLIDNGVHVLPAVPKLQDIMNLENITLSIKDRATGKNLAIIQNCKAVSHSGGVQTKALSRVQINYLGTMFEDESGAQSEASGAADLP